jgi:hypothetical protein
MDWVQLLDQLECYVDDLDNALDSGVAVEPFIIPDTAALPIQALDRLAELQRRTDEVMSRYANAMTASRDLLQASLRTATPDVGAFLNEHA